MIILDTNCFNEGVINTKIETMGLKKVLRAAFDKQKFSILELSLFESYKHVIYRLQEVQNDHEKLLKKLETTPYADDLYITLEQTNLNSMISIHEYKTKISEEYQIIDNYALVIPAANALIIKYLQNAKCNQFLMNKVNYLDLLIISNILYISKKPDNKFEDILFITSDNKFFEFANEIIIEEALNNIKLFNLNNMNHQLLEQKILTDNWYSQKQIKILESTFIKLLGERDIELKDVIFPLLEANAFRNPYNFPWYEKNKFIVSWIDNYDNMYLNESGELIINKNIEKFENTHLDSITYSWMNIPKFDSLNHYEIEDEYRLINHNTFYVSVHGHYFLKGNATFMDANNVTQVDMNTILHIDSICEEYYIKINFDDFLQKKFNDKSDLIQQFRKSVQLIS